MIGSRCFLLKRLLKNGCFLPIWAGSLLEYLPSINLNQCIYEYAKQFGCICFCIYSLYHIAMHAKKSLSRSSNWHMLWIKTCPFAPSLFVNVDLSSPALTPGLRDCILCCDTRVSRMRITALDSPDATHLKFTSPNALSLPGREIKEQRKNVSVHFFPFMMLNKMQASPSPLRQVANKD